MSPAGKVLTPGDYRMWALHYVAQLLGRGRTVAWAEATTEGFGGPGEPGWQVRRGVICVGFWTNDRKSPARFSFPELVQTLDRLRALAVEPQQTVLELETA